MNNIKVVRRSCNSGIIHRAGKILLSSDRMLENGFIATLNGVILETGSARNISDTHGIDGSYCGNNGFEIIDHGPGTIIPPLVNAHTHFELSALRGALAFGVGFNQWVRELLLKREACGTELLRQKAKEEMDDLADNGTLFAGEISTLGITEDIFINSDLGGVWFQEYLGAERSLVSPLSSESSLLKKSSIAGHAPHTTSPEFLKKMKSLSALSYLPFSIHLSESFDEVEFIKTGSGRWADFLREREIDFSSWPLPSRSPVQYLYDMGILDGGTIAVHLLDVDSSDMEILAKTSTKSVLCPRSNINLHSRLPDIPPFFKYGLKPALGTDSLASNHSLGMFDEMAYVLEHYPEIRPSMVLRMATLNGAEALGIGNSVGTIEKGRSADFIYSPVCSSGSDIESIIEEIIASHVFMSV